MQRFSFGLALTGALALTLMIPLGAAGAKPSKPPPAAGQELTVAAKPNPVVFGQSTTISGQLKGADKAGVTVVLQASSDGSGSFKDAATKTTDQGGSYSFTASPKLNTTYRVVAKTAPPITSSEVRVSVRIKVGLRLSDYSVRRGQLVRFSGYASPAHDGRTVYIQRRTASGSYRTVARTVLKDAGSSISRYARRIRISDDGVFRARILGDSDHVTGTSRTRAATVG